MINIAHFRLLICHVFASALLISWFCPGPAAAQKGKALLSITRGARNRQVLQRDSTGVASLTLEGSLPEELRGEIYVTVSRNGNLLNGFKDRAAGKAESGVWSASVADLPTGGPYDIYLVLKDQQKQIQAEVSVLDVLVGDLWILAGQSNMQGIGRLVDVEQPAAMVHAFDLADQWTVAEEPLHRRSGAVDAVHQDKAEDSSAETPPTRGAGLSLSFAKEIYRQTGVPIGLIPCALGGTPISKWDPRLKASGGHSLYGAMLRRAGAAGGKIAGVLWYQGEADARGTQAAPVYGQKLQELIHGFRADLQRPELPFYWVQLSRMLELIYYPDPSRRPPNLDSLWTLVRESQREVASRISSSGMVAAIDLELEDAIHIATPDLKRLGVRLARRALRDYYRREDIASGPSLDSVEHDRVNQKIRVHYSGVTGRLEAPGRISGFSLHRTDGTEVPAIFRASVEPDGTTLVLSYDGELPADTSLVYGWGTNPYCNVKDAADMAAPCFGPVMLRSEPK